MGAVPANVAVVTGASRGLGAALADALIDRGFRVATCARSAPPRDAALVRAVDVTDGIATERFASEVHRELGPIDLWINNAGVIGPIGPMRTADAEEWRRCLEVNVLGTSNGSRSFLNHCSSGATLLNIASRAGVRPAAGLAAYSCSKAAVIALTMSIAAEESDTFVRVVLPPSVDTDMQDELLGQDVAVFPGVVDSRRRRDAGQIVSASDAARLILSAVLDERRDTPVIDLT
jgi:NAD(P)-dependent dehydrogenase (short-subunit alcohol dehydrogenase family)